MRSNRKHGHLPWQLAVVVFAGLAAATSLSVSAGVAAASKAEVHSVTHASSNPRHGGTITYAAAALAWASLDPARSGTANSDQLIEYTLDDAWFGVDSSGKPTPDLATGYTLSSNRLVFTIDLRKGVKFTDGSSWNSAVATWNLNRDDSPLCQCYTGIEAMKTAVAAGPYVMKVYMSYPSSVFIDALEAGGGGAAYPVSETAFNSEGASAFATAPVGAGPFKISQNLVSSSLTLVRNPTYWDKPLPYLNGVTILSTGSDAATLAAVQAGTAQVGQTADFPTMKEAQAAGLQIWTLPATSFDYLQLATDEGLMSHLSARQALLEATNDKTLVSSLTLGLGKGSESLMASGEYFYPGKTVDGYINYNPSDAAKKVAALKAQGVDTSFNFWDCGTDTPAVLQLLDALSTMWQAAGFTVNIQEYSHVQAIGFLETGGYQVEACAYGGSPDPSLTTGLWITPSLYNKIYNDPVVDQLVERSEETFSFSQRKVLFDKALVQSNKDASVFTLWQYSTRLITPKSVQGFVPYLPTPALDLFWLK